MTGKKQYSLKNTGYFLNMEWFCSTKIGLTNDANLSRNPMVMNVLHENSRSFFNVDWI